MKPLNKVLFHFYYKKPLKMLFACFYNKLQLKIINCFVLLLKNFLLFKLFLSIILSFLFQLNLAQLNLL